MHLKFICWKEEEEEEEEEVWTSWPIMTDWEKRLRMELISPVSRFTPHTIHSTQKEVRYG